MKENKINALDSFLKKEESEKELEEKTNAQKVMIDGRSGLIERVDKIFVTKDGRQLLREQY
jgi:hypothetical protein